MKQPRKKLPDLRSEENARKFWGTPGRDSTEYLDWSKARVARLPNVKLSTRTISLRLPEGLLERIKLEANKRDAPYQSLIKVWLAEKVTLSNPAAAGNAAAKRFIGSDKRPGDVARNSRRLLRHPGRGK